MVWGAASLDVGGRLSILQPGGPNQDSRGKP